MMGWPIYFKLFATRGRNNGEKKEGPGELLDFLFGKKSWGTDRRASVQQVIRIIPS